MLILIMESICFDSARNWGWDLFCNLLRPSLLKGGMCSLIGGFEVLLGLPWQSSALFPTGAASLLYLWTHRVLLGTSQRLCLLCGCGRGSVDYVEWHSDVKTHAHKHKLFFWCLFEDWKCRSKAFSLTTNWRCQLLQMLPAISQFQPNNSDLNPKWVL